jgi:hypothetical protein
LGDLRSAVRAELLAATTLNRVRLTRNTYSGTQEMRTRHAELLPQLQQQAAVVSVRHRCLVQENPNVISGKTRVPAPPDWVTQSSILRNNAGGNNDASVRQAELALATNTVVLYVKKASLVGLLFEILGVIMLIGFLVNYGRFVVYVIGAMGWAFDEAGWFIWGLKKPLPLWCLVASYLWMNSTDNSEQPNGRALEESSAGVRIAYRLFSLQPFRRNSQLEYYMSRYGMDLIWLRVVREAIYRAGVAGSINFAAYLPIAYKSQNANREKYYLALAEGFTHYKEVVIDFAAHEYLYHTLNDERAGNGFIAKCKEKLRRDELKAGVPNPYKDLTGMVRFHTIEYTKQRINFEKQEDLTTDSSVANWRPQSY